MNLSFDVAVIGAGPGGYVAAIRAAQLGLKTIVIDKRSKAGGTCLNVGCIPSKALLHASQKFWETKTDLDKFGISVDNIRLDLKKFLAQKDNCVEELTQGIGFLFKKNNIHFEVGEAKIVGPHAITITTSKGEIKNVTASKIIIATGSEPAALPGIEIDEETVVTSTGALNLKKVPQHLVVIGGGYIGLEMASVWSRLGSAITVIEYSSGIVPHMDGELRLALQKNLEKEGFVFKFDRKVVKVSKNPKSITVQAIPVKEENDRGGEMVECDAVLVAVGRVPFTQGLGLESLGINVNQRGFVEVNQNFQTKVPTIFAIGDAVGGAMLAHKASHEGIAVAEFIAGQSAHVNYEVIPSVIYTHPEVASVGKTEEELKAAGIPYNVGKFPFTANSRAKTVKGTTGFVKVLAHKETDEVLGVHIIGDVAGTMIAEAAMAMEFKASSEDIARTCHAHPTYSEGLMEAAWATFAKAVHS